MKVKDCPPHRRIDVGRFPAILGQIADGLQHVQELLLVPVADVRNLAKPALLVELEGLADGMYRRCLETFPHFVAQVQVLQRFLVNPAPESQADGIV